MSQETPPAGAENQELRILRLMRKTLTDVARDTQTPPGMRHPLSDDTIENIRDCLRLITARESELAARLGLSQALRPRFSDEPPEALVVRFEPGPRHDKN
jgi:hypothetical protein